MGIGPCRRNYDVPRLTIMSMSDGSIGDDGKSRPTKPLMMMAPLRSVKNISESPKLPVPSLSHTFRKYLQHLKLLRFSEFSTSTHSVTDSFIREDGHKLQKKLYERYMKSTNWANEFWLEKFLLSPRHPLPIFTSKGFLFPKQSFNLREDHLIFASKTIHCLIEVMLFMHEYQLPIISRAVGYSAHLGHNRYLVLDFEELNSTFRGYRLPGINCDLLIPAARRGDNEHIIIAYKNHLFLVDVIINREFKSVSSIRKGIENCIAMAEKAEPQQVGILTCDERTNWASNRKLLSRDNLDNLTKIEKSMFVVCLDFESHDNVDNKTRYIQMLCGAQHSMGNRWFDKPIQLIINSDGSWGLCIEKSLVDEEIIIPVVQHLVLLVNNEGGQSPVTSSSSAMLMSLMRDAACPCSILKWDLNDFIILRMILIFKTMKNNISKLDYAISEYKHYGGDFLKKNAINSEAFMHLAFHLTYYKAYNQVGNIYSSVSLRKFRHGREDNCRSMTPELIQWCKGMCYGSMRKKSKFILMRKALSKQVECQNDVLKGMGIDNHILALEQLSAQTMTAKPEIFESDDFKKYTKYSMYAKSIDIAVGMTTCPGVCFQDCFTVEANVSSNKIMLATVRVQDDTGMDSSSFNSSLYQTVSDMMELIEGASRQ